MEPPDTEVLLVFIIKFLQLNAWITELQTTDEHQTIINQNLPWSENYQWWLDMMSKEKF